MKYTPIINQALAKAAILHKNHTRKTEKRPYITHPVAVALMVSEFTNNSNTIAAALLHDVVEDVPSYTHQDLKKEFGNEIAHMVKELSEKRKYPKDQRSKLKQNWQLRKSGYLNQLQTANREVLLVSICDKIHNLQSLNDALKNQGNKIWLSFNAPLAKQLWFYTTLGKIYQNRVPNELFKLFNKEVEKLRKS